MRNISHFIIKRRFILSISLVIIIASVLIAMYGQLQKEKQEEATPVTASLNQETRRVFVKDIHTLKTPSDPKLRIVIENALYAYALNSNAGAPDLFTGTIRPNSYSSSANGIVTFLVDVEPVNTTYLVTVNDTLGDDSYVNVNCAIKTQQIHQDTTCKELDGIT